MQCAGELGASGAGDALVRLGLADLLNADDGIEMVAQATDGLQAARRAVLLARGETNVDIADRLTMAEGTVKAHANRILTALEVTNRVQAALVARDAGLST